MNLLQYYSILKARIKTIALVILVTVGVAAGISILMPKTYTATTTLLLDIKVREPAGGQALTSLMPEVLQGYLTAQAEVVASEKTATRVINSLSLLKNEAFRARWEGLAGEKPTFELWLLQALVKSLDVKTRRENNIISIAFSNPDAVLAEAIANAFAQAYLETDLDLKVEPARKSAAWFDERTKAMRTRLELARSKLSEFERKNKVIVAADEKVDAEYIRLNELSAQLAAVQTAAAEAESKRSQAGGLAEVIQSPAVQTLRTDLARAQAKLRELAAQIGTNHPQYQRLDAEANALRERVAMEMAQVAGTVGAAARVSQQREAQIKAAYEAQKAKVLATKAVRDEGAVLLRDVEAARREYDALLQGLAQTSLESLATQTNIVVLNRATKPLHPASPKLKLNLLVALLVGAMVGAGIALVLENLDRRFRHAHEVADILHLPVLARIADGASNARLAFQSQAPRLPNLGSADG